MYDNNGIPGTSDYWHSYYLWYETYPLAAVTYSGSPSLTQGWTLEFNVTYTSTYIYYWVIIENTTTVYTGSTWDPFGYSKPYYIATIVEDDQFSTAGGRFFGQLPEFSESDFAGFVVFQKICRLISNKTTKPAIIPFSSGVTPVNCFLVLTALKGHFEHF